MTEGFRLCIRYRVSDRLAYLSHLETVEAMRRIVRRAQLSYAVSEGFSPHMKASFGPALPVGAGGDNELFDVRLTEYIDPDEALSRLQAMAPVHLMPESADYIDPAAPALDIAFPISIWKAVFEGGHDAEASRALVSSAFSALVETGGIEVVKKKRGKLKTRTIDFDTHLIEKPSCEIDEFGDVKASFATCQREDGALRPDLFIDRALEGIEGAPRLRRLTRENLLPLP